MAEREVRIAHTEALFRDVNERIAESAGRFAALVCECADPACAERVPATLDQYRFVVVEKFNPIVAQTVRRLDPRTLSP